MITDTSAGEWWDAAGLSKPTTDRARARWNPQGHLEVVHRCPPIGSGEMPCCGRTPIEVPQWHRLTLDPALVTCEGEKD